MNAEIICSISKWSRIDRAHVIPVFDALSGFSLYPVILLQQITGMPRSTQNLTKLVSHVFLVQRDDSPRENGKSRYYSLQVWSMFK